MNEQPIASAGDTDNSVHASLSAQTVIAGDVTFDGFPSRTSSIRTAQLYNNGAQQLAIRIRLGRVDSPVSAEEWDSLELYHADKTTPVAFLPFTPGKPLILDPEGPPWATTWLRDNHFEQSHELSFQMRTEEHVATWSHRVLYLHARAQKTIGKFYVRLTDLQGEHHWFPKEAPIEVELQEYEPINRFSITAKRIEGFQHVLSEDESSTRYFNYDYNLRTIEYFRLFVAGGFVSCDVSGLANEAPAKRTSIVRFERNALSERLCSVTGLVLGRDQHMIEFDKNLTTLDFEKVFGEQIIKAFNGYLDENTVIISVHRLDAAPYIHIPEAWRDSISNTYNHALTFTFRDHQGNEISKTIHFLEDGNASHRDRIN
ncbi:hypothetical protein [Pseudomonas sichuanensis]|uniref:Uncharacterized protein n=1 Tax=Pseudomonas sichuanensis TaxID=2213015 RepID=A0ABV0DB72_9PSED